MEKKMQKSDFRMGLVDDDGDNMPKVINRFSSGEDVPIPSPSVTPKNLEDEYLIKPILLDGKIKKRFLALFGEESYTGPVYLWNKLSDPNVSPNDYLVFESGNFSVTHFMTHCKGIISIDELNRGEDIDSKILMELSQDLKGFDIEEEDDDLIDLINEEAEVPEDLLSGSDNETDFKKENMKLKDALAYVQSYCCQKRLNNKPYEKNCQKRHYFIGVGNVQVQKSLYCGIHVYLFPDAHYEQCEEPEKEILDVLYLKFKKGETQENITLIHKYVREFQKVLRQ